MQRNVVHLRVVLSDRLPNHFAPLVDVRLDRRTVDQRVELRVDVASVVERAVTGLVVVRAQHRRQCRLRVGDCPPQPSMNMLVSYFSSFGKYVARGCDVTLVLMPTLVSIAATAMQISSSFT